MPKECVADANIFIDFESGNIFAVLAHPSLALCTTDFIIDDIDEPTSTDLEAAGITISSLDGTQIARLSELTALYRKPSFADLSALALAEHDKSILLTGDSDLRSAAEDLGIEVHGTIWILDHLVSVDALTKPAASMALEAMADSNRRLPSLIVKRRLSAWKDSH